MTIYRCEGYRPIHSTPDDDQSPSEIFANRMARKAFGKRGYARTVRLDSWSEDGSTAHYEAFIGIPVRGERGTTVGHNERFTVYRTEEAL